MFSLGEALTLDVDLPFLHAVRLPSKLPSEDSQIRPGWGNCGDLLGVRSGAGGWSSVFAHMETLLASTSIQALPHVPTGFK